MGDQDDYEGIVAEIARYLVGFVAWFVLLTFKSLLIFGGPGLIVGLVILPFMKNPWGDWNGLSIAVFLTCAFAWILAWLWLIVRPLVNSILPYGHTVERILAGWLTSLARRGRAAP